MILFTGILVITSGVKVVKAATMLTQKTSISDISNIGDEISCRYVAPTAGQVGDFSELGTTTANPIPTTGTATPDGSFNWIYAGDDSQGRKILVADRNVQTGINRETLNASNVIDGLLCKTGVTEYTPIMTSNSTNQYVISADSYLTPNDAYHGLYTDNSIKQWWSYYTPPIGGHWWKLDYGAGNGKNINQISWNGTLSSGSSYSLKDFVIYGSNDDMNYNTLYSATNPNDDRTHTYSFDNTNSYRYYKFVFPNGDYLGNIYAGFGGLRLYNTTKTYLVRSLTGGISSTDSNNEWDTLIANSTLTGANNVWNWNGISSWTSTTPTGTIANRVIRGGSSASTYSSLVSGTANTTTGFRPVLILPSTSTPTNVPATNITLNKSTLTLPVGQSEALTPTISPTDATNQNVTWTSSDPTVATVDSTGKVTGVKVGTTIITATTVNGKTATCTVNVINPVVTGRALLTITMTNGMEKEYDLSMTEVNMFIDWYNGRAGGAGNAYYSFKKNSSIAPFIKRTEYILYDKIVEFNVDEYTPQ